MDEIRQFTEEQRTEVLEMGARAYCGCCPDKSVRGTYCKICTRKEDYLDRLYMELFGEPRRRLTACRGDIVLTNGEREFAFRDIPFDHKEYWEMYGATGVDLTLHLTPEVVCDVFEYLQSITSPASGTEAMKAAKLSRFSGVVEKGYQGKDVPLEITRCFFVSFDFEDCMLTIACKGINWEKYVAELKSRGEN